MFYWACLSIIKILIKIIYRHRWYGFDVSSYDKGAILAANHASFLDPPLVAISCPQEICFLARSTLFTPIWFGKLIGHLNAYPVKRGGADAGSFRQVVKLLKEGKKVVMFPEGKRTKNGQLQPLKPGCFVMASRGESAIIPIYIHGSFDIWGPHRKFPKLLGKTVCVIGRPIEYPFAYDALTDEGIAHLYLEYTSRIEKLKNWYEQGAQGELPC